jgi:dTDP-4-amino-4,6-dideoxygalactose transaminase
LGTSQLAQLDEFILRRVLIAEHYTHTFWDAGIECPDGDPDNAWFRYLIAVDEPGSKVEQLVERGIEAGRGVYPPLHRLAGIKDDRFSGATWCVNHLLSVPVHPSLTDNQVEFIAEQVVQVCA